MTLYHFTVTLHVLAAMLWLGGMLFLGLVGAPILRAVEPAALRQRLFRDLGMRFRTVGWIAIWILVLTGIANLHFRGWLSWHAALGNRVFWSTPAGHALGIKLCAVTAMLVLQAFHDFVQGPRATRLAPDSVDAIQSRRRAMMLARVSAVLGVIVVGAAVRLARA